jgi:hypothetical protein
VSGQPQKIKGRLFRVKRKSLTLIAILACLLVAAVPSSGRSASDSAPSTGASAAASSVANSETPAPSSDKTSSANNGEQGDTGGFPILVPFMVLALAATFVWFLAVFTRRLKGDTEADYNEITPMVRFCYFFTILSFALAVVPPFIVRYLPQQAYDTFVRSPVGIVKGCVHTTAQSDWELACSKDDPFKVQWLFNIGGSARYRVPPVPPVAVAAKDRLTEQIDDRVESTNFQPVVVHGGLAVPWYFLTLAIIGAAISLARKVPEYQRRAISKEDALNGPKLREYLEFQILQVLCAPFIATTVYNIVTPSSLAVAATLGFSSGFASETILLGIRAGLDPVMKFFNDRIVAATGDQTKTDDEVMADIKTKFAADADLKGLSLDVSAIPGVVELKGKVATDALSKKAEDLARAAAGKRTIKNSLTVGA